MSLNTASKTEFETGKTFPVGQKNFESLVTSNGIVVLDFWADWCAPCKTYAPVFEDLAQKNPDIYFGKINTEEEQELSGGLGIRSIPTTMIFRDGIMLFEKPGALPQEMLESVLGEIKKLDMKKVLEEIEKNEKEHGHSHGGDEGGCCGGGCH